MFSIQYLLVKPKEIVKKLVKLQASKKGEVVVKPEVSGICASDLHYYLGHKDPEKLKKRLPLVLFHEGVVRVLKTSKNSKLKKGEKVIIIPLMPCGKCFACKIGEYNLCSQAKFMASTAPGLARLPFIYPESLLLKIPKDIPDEIAALAEPFSTCLRSVIVARVKEHDKVVVIGDGPMGFFIALILSVFSKIKKQNLYVIGMFDEKLKLVRDFAIPLNITRRKNQIKIEKLKQNFDVAFECVGGKAMAHTFSQALDLVRPKSKAIILGISDDLTAIKTIKIVNSGLQIFGSSRSRIEDYKAVLNLMRNKEVQKRLVLIINPKKFNIKSEQDLTRAFGYASDMRHLGRVMVYF